MDKKKITYNDTEIEIPISINLEEIEDNDFIPDSGDNTMDLEEVLRVARILKLDTQHNIEMDDIID